MSEYRLSAGEFLYLAQYHGLERLPAWLEAAVPLEEDEAVRLLLERGFLLPDDENGGVCVHPIARWLYRTMAQAPAWCSFENGDLAYVTEEACVSLEKEGEGYLFVRILPFETFQDFCDHYEEELEENGGTIFVEDSERGAEFEKLIDPGDAEDGAEDTESDAPAGPEDAEESEDEL